MVVGEWDRGGGVDGRGGRDKEEGRTGNDG